MVSESPLTKLKVSTNDQTSLRTMGHEGTTKTKAPGQITLKGYHRLARLSLESESGMSAVALTQYANGT